jgi:hypothetical protein
MIQITPQMRVLIAIDRVDGRKGLDSLARLCQEKLAEDPFSGCVFVFRSRSGTTIRLLSYDGQGYEGERFKNALRSVVVNPGNLRTVIERCNTTPLLEDRGWMDGRGLQASQVR